MSRLNLKFNGRFREPMLDGTKPCTLRRGVKAQVGDVFPAWEREWQVTRVDAATPAFVAKHYFREEGFETPADFLSFWRKIHPRGSLKTPHTHIWFAGIA